MSSHDGHRPWCMEAVYLFDARQLINEQRGRGVRTGTASSVRAAQWTAAEIYPRATNWALPLSHGQVELLKLFATV